MRLLSKNPTFAKHKVLIQEVISLKSGVVSSNGKDLFREMLVSADELDALMDPAKGIRPDPHLVTVKRDEFHKRCRDMGAWLEEHAPDLKLSWD